MKSPCFAGAAWNASGEVIKSRRSGLNAIAWALHNGEQSHAIVWHHLSADLDGGDSVERRETAIDQEETSLSPNMKCAVKAFEAFCSVLHQLESGRLAESPQDKSIERTEYSRHDRPPRFAILDWTDRAETIDALIRACHYGAFPHPFAATKVLHRGIALAVTKALLELEDTTLHVRPWRIVSISPFGITVACRLGQIARSKFATLTGDRLTIE